MVPRHHGYRNDRVRTPLPQRGASQSPLPHRHQRHAHAQEPGSAEQGAEGVSESMLDRRCEQAGHGEGDSGRRFLATGRLLIEQSGGYAEVPKGRRGALGK